MKKSIFLFLSLCFCGFNTQAQFTTNTAINTMVRDSLPEEVTPLSALNPIDGSTYVSWFNQNGSGGYDFSMQLIDKNGNLLWPTSGITVSNYPQLSYVSRYDLVTDGEGNAITTMQDIRNGPVSVVAYKLAPNGTRLWGNAGIDLFDSLGTSGVSARIGVLPTNDAIIAWNVDGSPRDWVAFQRVNANGTLPWGTTPKRIIDSTFTFSTTRPQIIPSIGGDFLVFSVQQTGSFPFIGTMYMQRYDGSGNPVWASPVQLSTKTIGFVHFPSIVSDGAGGAFVAFTTSNPASLSINDTYVQHIDASGNLWSLDGTEAVTGANSHREAVSMFHDITSNSSWILMKELNLSQSNSGITVQRLDAAGNRLLGVTGAGVIPVGAYYFEPYEIRQMDNQAVIVYKETNGSMNLLFATRIDSNGVTTWSSGGVMICDANNDRYNVTLTPYWTDGTDGQCIAVWEDLRYDRGVYAQNISGIGTLGSLFTGSQELSGDLAAASVYPNPSRTLPHLHYNSGKSTSVTLQLMDQAGRMISTKSSLKINAGVNDFRLSDLFNNIQLAPGNYTLVLSDENTSNTMRLTILE